MSGHDMRPSSPGLSGPSRAARRPSARDVTEIGLCSTDQLYYASGALDLPGAMFTASHNPAQYNGIKMCRAGAAPVGQDTGLAEIRELVEGWTRRRAPRSRPRRPGTITAARHVAGLRGPPARPGRPDRHPPPEGRRRRGQRHGRPHRPDGLRRPAPDTGPDVLRAGRHLPQPRGQPARPREPRRPPEAGPRGAAPTSASPSTATPTAASSSTSAASPVSPSAITALVAARELAKHGGKGTIIHNLITSWSVPEVVQENGGSPVRTRVGHSFIKAEMARTGAIFGGEHSAHYYFRDFWNADTGMLAALHVLAALGGQDGPLSALVAQYDRYAGSGEINSTVDDQAGRLAAIKAAYEDREGVTLDELDGLTVSAADWWFNVRPSNTEPLLRLNAEARDEATMTKVRDEALAIIRA